jgi:transposase
MPRGRKVSPEQIVVMLRQIEVQLAQGKSLAQACKEAGLSEQGRHRRLARPLQPSSAALILGLPATRACHPRLRQPPTHVTDHAIVSSNPVQIPGQVNWRPAMNKKYRVTLTLAEREELERLLARGKADVRRLRHAQILLKADEADGGPAWPDARIAEAFKAGITTVERVRQRFVEEGLGAALNPYRAGTRVYERKLDGAQEAHLIALACSAPPDGRARWTLRLLAQHMVELAYVDTLSHETVRQTLKKERPPAAPQAHVVHPREALGGVRPLHGGRARGLSSPA